MVKKEREITKKKLESFTLASAFEMIYEKSCYSKHFSYPIFQRGRCHYKQTLKQYRCGC